MNRRRQEYKALSMEMKFVDYQRKQEERNRKGYCTSLFMCTNFSRINSSFK